jgi:hypothetical protein
MSATTPPSRPYSDRIVPAWLWPQSGTAGRVNAETYAAAQEVAEQTSRNYTVAAGQLEELIAGDGAEAMIDAHRQVAVIHARHADICRHFHKGSVYTGELARQLATCLDNIDSQAHQKISASPPEAREGIIAAAHASAQAAVADFAETFAAHHSYVAGLVDPMVAGIIGQVPPPTDKDPTIQALSSDGGLEQEPGKRGCRAGGSGGDVDGLDQEAARGGDLVGTKTGGTGGPSGLEPRAPYPIEPPPFSVPRPPASPSPLSGGLGGITSGFGGGSPLSGFATGSPAGIGSGLGAGPGAAVGMPESVAGAAGQGGVLGQPSSAFAKGLAAASGGGGVPFTPPMTASAPAAPSTAGGPATDGVGAGAAAGGSGMSAGPASAASGQVPAAPSGVHVPAAGGMAASGGPAAMLLPPPPMGPSGAAAAEGVSAPVSGGPSGPATSLAGSSSSSSGAGLSGGAPGVGADVGAGGGVDAC